MKKVASSLLSIILVAGCTLSKYVNDVRSVQLVKSTVSWNGHPLPAYKTGAPEITVGIKGESITIKKPENNQSQNKPDTVGGK